MSLCYHTLCVLVGGAVWGRAGLEKHSTTDSSEGQRGATDVATPEVVAERELNCRSVPVYRPQ